MRLPLPLTRRAVSSSLRALLGLVVGYVAIGLLYLPLYESLAPAFAAEGQVLRLVPEEIKRAVGIDDFSTGAGYVTATYYGLLGTVLAAVGAIGWGIGGVAGPEESGRLELVLAHGTTRTRYWVQQVLALVVLTLLLCAAAAAMPYLLNDSEQLGLALENQLAMLAQFWGLTLLTGMVPLAVGGATGHRGAALGLGVLVAGGGFLLNAVGRIDADLAFLTDYSPYGWVFEPQPLLNGWDPRGLVLLFGSALLLMIVGGLLFRRRDLR
jgi:ABC-2 type transport system permease protein